MANEKITELPSVIEALSADIIYAVQGGVSVQETLEQVLDLSRSTLIANYAGNPNGNVAGTTYSLCWDSSDNFLWICTTSGTAGTAVWKPCVGTMTNGQTIIGSTGAVPSKATLTAGTGITISNAAGSITIAGTGSGMSWTVVTAASATMSADNGYIANRGSLVTLTLPASSSVGTTMSIVGQGAGGWLIAQGAGQQIQVGSSASTSGAGGSVASTNRYDSINLICITANTTWVTQGAPQSSGLTIV